MREITTVKAFAKVTDLEESDVRRVLGKLAARSAKGKSIFTGAEVKAILADAGKPEAKPAEVEKPEAPAADEKPERKPASK